MSSDDKGFIWEVSNKRVSRRSVLKGAAALGGIAALGPLASACGGSDESSSTSDDAEGTPNQGGSLRVGLSGGSAKDTADPQVAVDQPDIALAYVMYEGLMRYDSDGKLVNEMAETIEPNDDGSVWKVTLKPDMLWHDGKPVTADDIVYSFDRIVDPKDPKAAAPTLAGLKVGNTKKVDERTIEFNLDTPNVIFSEVLAVRSAKMVPVDFDPKNPIGSGGFKMTDFKPGEQFTFDSFADYYDGAPYVDDLTLIEFGDETARVNALSSGEVEAIMTLPTSQARATEATSGLKLLEAETGGWRPFTMRIDVKPYNDVRVRQAFRLIVDRQQMIDQAYNGFGVLANDMYARYDPGTPDLPQREQDIEQAKSLLKQAGYDGDLTVELVTSAEALGADEVAAAQVFAEQAKAAGVKVELKKVDSSIFYGKDYLAWPFAQDFWATRGFLSQASQGSTPDSPYNETHWENAEWLALVNEAFITVDEDKRNELVSQAQTIEHNEGGYIVWAWRNEVDAYSDKITGLKGDPQGYPLGAYNFKKVYFV